MVWNRAFATGYQGDVYGGAIDTVGNFYFSYSTNTWSQDTVRLRKYDNHGNFMWDKQLRTFSSFNIVFNVESLTDDQQNIYSIIQARSNNSSYRNIYIYKYDGQGILLYSKLIPDVYIYYGVKAGKSGTLYLQYDSTSSGYGVITRHISNTGSTLFYSRINHLRYTYSMTLDNYDNLWLYSYKVTSTQDTTTWYKMDTLGVITDSLIIPISEPGKILFDSQNNITISYNQIYPPNSNYYDSIKAGFRRYDSNMNLVWDTGPTKLVRIDFIYQNKSGDLFVYGDRFGFANNNQSARLAKIDTSGNITWTNKFGPATSPTQYFFSNFLPDTSGNPVMVGGYYPPGYGTVSSTDMFFVRTTNTSGVNTAYEEYINPDIYGRVSCSRIINNQLYMMSLGRDMTMYQICISCRATLTGNVYFDADSSCTKGAQEAGIYSGVFVQPGSTFLHTDTLGNYKAYLSDNNYEVIFPSYFNYHSSCNADTIPITIANGALVNVNHGKYLNPLINDIMIESGHGALRPGFHSNYSVRYTNIGGSNQTGVVEFIHDANLTFIQSVPPISFISGDTLRWNYSNLAVLGYADIQLKFRVDSQVAIGTYIVNDIHISGNIPEFNLADNVVRDSSVVTGSFDPNDKSVFPAGVGPLGYIRADNQPLNYTIRFENTGNDTAFMVTILDTLDGDLDIATFKPGVSSHNYRWEIINGNTLRIRFINIYLAGSAYPNLNKGYVCYSIQQKHGLPNGSTIKNRAQIFFDYNLPVATNTTINTIDSTLNVADISKTQFVVFPNPANDKITLVCKDSKSKLVIYNMFGQALKYIKPGVSMNEFMVIEVDIADLPVGIYIINQDGINSKGIRFVKM